MAWARVHPYLSTDLGSETDPTDHERRALCVQARQLCARAKDAIARAQMHVADSERMLVACRSGNGFDEVMVGVDAEFDARWAAWVRLAR